MNKPILFRIKNNDRKKININIENIEHEVYEGDTLMTAILVFHNKLNNGEFGKVGRAGFCFMGACQDCWVKTNDGEYLQACTTFVKDGMSIIID